MDASIYLLSYSEFLWGPTNSKRLRLKGKEETKHEDATSTRLTKDGLKCNEQPVSGEVMASLSSFTPILTTCFGGEFEPVLLFLSLEAGRGAAALFTVSSSLVFDLRPLCVFRWCQRWDAWITFYCRSRCKWDSLASRETLPRPFASTCLRYIRRCESNRSGEVTSSPLPPEFSGLSLCI